MSALGQQCPDGRNVTDGRIALERRHSRGSCMWQQFVNFDEKLFLTPNTRKYLPAEPHLVSSIRRGTEKFNKTPVDSSQRHDLHLTVAQPATQLPAVGATISVTGVITSYEPQPFKFTMAQVEVN